MGQKWFDHFSEDTGHEKKVQTSDVRGKGIFFRIFGEDGKGGGRRAGEDGRESGRPVRKTGFME